MNWFFNKNKPPSNSCECDNSPPIPNFGRFQNFVRRRPMKYPYTLTAKVAQFPLLHYIKHNWVWRYYIGGLILSAPVFWYITKITNSPENVARWAEIKRREKEEHEHKFK
ncbi:unnamed protein product [Phyllotreta striolata]|uniref:Uncharacterized protein n=1 Tax=Phyllotreta striolata TaxID=444603 RepID=A0A9N9XUM1_PHYSR|nr:unnamed protein product [Phyllotreta striolata]